MELTVVGEGLQAADRQAWRTLWAQVLSSSVTECLSGSCSSLDVMFLWTVCRKLLAPDRCDIDTGGCDQNFTQQLIWLDRSAYKHMVARLTILHAVVGPVRTLVRIISRNSELQRRNAGEVFIIWQQNTYRFFNILVVLIHKIWSSRADLSLTQFADQVHGAVVAAVQRIQVDQELDVKASHLSLKDVGDGVPLIVFVFPLPARDVGTSEEMRKFINKRHCYRTQNCKVWQFSWVDQSLKPTRWEVRGWRSLQGQRFGTENGWRPESGCWPWQRLEAADRGTAVWWLQEGEGVWAETTGRNCYCAEYRSKHLKNSRQREKQKLLQQPCRSSVSLERFHISVASSEDICETEGIQGQSERSL